MTDRLTEHERFIITRARELSPVYRRSGDVRYALAGQLLSDLADLAERLAAAQATEDSHG